MSTYLHGALTGCFYRVTNSFIVHLPSVIASMSRKFLLETRDIWVSSDCNRTRPHNHLVRKRTPEPNEWLCCEYLSVWCTDCVFLSWLIRFQSLSDSFYTRMDMEKRTVNAQYRYKYSQHSSFISSVRLNGWVFVYELSSCGFESCYSHLSFRYRVCFEQRVLWHSPNYRL